MYAVSEVNVLRKIWSGTKISFVKETVSVRFRAMVRGKISRTTTIDFSVKNDKKV